jgi:ATPase components of ABC transporters with duplicated ATPase domains
LCIKKFDKIEKVELLKWWRVVEFDFFKLFRSGDDVANLLRVKKVYGDLVIYDGFDLLFRWRECWCVLGVNGVGKSMLLKFIVGAIMFDEGDVKIGASVKMGYFVQHAMELLDS